MNLKEKTVKGVLWNGIELFGGRFIQIAITIFLARLLVPEDFGVIGLLIIFTELSKVLLDSGFSQALIRKQDVNQEDYTAVFYFNIFIGLILYVLLFLMAPLISQFYNFSELTNISRVVFLTVIINSFGIVQNAKIVQEVDFKKLASRTIIANVISGLLAIYLAYSGFGVWALIWQMVTASFLRVTLLWVSSKWLPSVSFNFKPIKELFPFSSNLLLSGLFDVIASNIQTLLIGKFYTKADLGHYTQAKLISGIPSQTITSIIRNVTYPTLSVLQNDVVKLKEAFRKVIKIAVFAIFPLMLGLMAIGNNLIPLVLGEKWLPAVPYFIILCAVGAVFPMYSINQNLFLILGKGRLHLNVSFAKRTITLLMIVITVKISVTALVLGHLIATIINTIVTMYYSGKVINYSLKEQIKDIVGIVLISVVMAILVFYCSHILNLSLTWWTLVFQILFGLLIYFGFSFLFNFKTIVLIRENLRMFNRKV